MVTYPGWRMLPSVGAPGVMYTFHQPRCEQLPCLFSGDFSSLCENHEDGSGVTGLLHSTIQLPLIVTPFTKQGTCSCPCVFCGDLVSPDINS